MGYRVYHRTGEGSEKKVCRPKHTWNGERPVLDPMKLEWQNGHLKNVKCDCGSTVYGEEEDCGCDGVTKWSIKEESV